MRKCLLLLLLAATLLLTACTALAEAEPQVEAMLTAIEENDAAAALALLHPSIVPQDSTEKEDFSRKIALWYELFGGEKWEKYAYNNVSVHKSGSSRTEEAGCYVTLKDGTKLVLEYTYFENAAGEGFLAFSLRASS